MLFRSIVVLSDGQDTESDITENQMFSACLPKSAEVDGIKLFPIAFGEGADAPLLKRMAHVSGDAIYQADPDSIERAYLRISAEQ